MSKYPPITPPPEYKYTEEPNFLEREQLENLKQETKELEARIRYLEGKVDILIKLWKEKNDQTP